MSKRARKIIGSQSNAISVSSATFWELAIKSSLGRIVIPRNLLAILRQNHFEILPILAEEALSIVDLPALHKDPFDRILIAQAEYNGLVLITRNDAIQSYPLTIVKA